MCAAAYRVKIDWQFEWAGRDRPCDRNAHIAMYTIHDLHYCRWKRRCWRCCCKKWRLRRKRGRVRLEHCKGRAALGLCRSGAVMFYLILSECFCTGGVSHSGCSYEKNFEAEPYRAILLSQGNDPQASTHPINAAVPTQSSALSST